MKKIKKYLRKFDLIEKSIAFFISVPLSHITIKSILLHDDYLAFQNGVLYFFISLFLYFFISLFFIDRYAQFVNLLTNKLSKKSVKIARDIVKLTLFPSSLLAISFFFIFIASAYQTHLSLLPESDFVTNNSIAREINNKYTSPIIFVYFVLIGIIQIIYLVKDKKLNIITSFVSILISILSTFIIFFVLAKIMAVVYWIILIIIGPWVPG